MIPPRNVLLAAALALPLSLGAAGQARADSFAGAGPGMVLFVGEQDRQHKLVVTDTYRDVLPQERDISKAPPELAQSMRRVGDELARLQSEVGHSQDDAPNLELQPFVDYLDVLLAGVLIPLPEDTFLYVRQVRDNAKDAIRIFRDYQAARKELAAAVEAADAARAAESSAARLGRLNSVVFQLTEKVEDLRGQSLVGVRDVEILIRRVDRLMAGVPSNIVRGVTRNLNKIAAALNRVTNNRGSFIPPGWKTIGRAAVFADYTLSLASLFSEHVIMIRDATGNPIDAQWPCRQVVRKEDGGTIEDAVTCPAPKFPLTFNLLDYLGPDPWPKGLLNVQGGTKTDEITIALDPKRQLFDEIYVEGHAGNDVIQGSAGPERIIGGPGTDTIKGGDGEDVIYGDNLFLNSDVDPSDAGDRLFGEGDDDWIDGDLGNDLVSGGPGNDSGWVWYGAALYGGPGNDTIHGGQGSDAMNGGPGRDALFAKESDYPDPLIPSVKQRDEFDWIVDCGGDPNSGDEHYTTSAPNLDRVVDCQSPPKFVPSESAMLKAAIPANGIWPWYR